MSRTNGNFGLRMTPRITSIFSKSNRVEIEFDRGIEAPVKSISLRLPREMLNQLKVLANKKDIPYQSLIKVYLAEKIAEERKAG
jgi:predicted DNA binding CopG/RHH family protein